MSIYFLVKWIWIAYLVVWMLAALTQKRSIRRQSPGSRALHIAVVLLALSPFLFFPNAGLFRRNLLPSMPALQIAGVVLLVCGIGFAFWARFILGRNWSGTVTVKQDHVLITRGPYAWVRHPIYSGLLLALLGTAFALNRMILLIGFGAILLAFWLKLRLEEKFMEDTFGEQYVEYRQRVKALIPYVM